MHIFLFRKIFFEKHYPNVLPVYRWTQTPSKNLVCPCFITLNTESELMSDCCYGTTAFEHREVKA